MEKTTVRQNPESPFERQLKRGFVALRFQDRLERAYRDRHVKEVAPVVRIALIVGLIFGSALTVMDYQLFPAEYYRWSIGIRMLVMAPAVLLGLALTWRASQPGLLALGGIVVGLSVGLGSLALGVIGLEQGVPAFFAGYTVITLYAYFLLGLLFWQALGIGLVLAGAFLAFGIVGELPAVQLAYDGLFLGFGNVIGIIGLYTLERTGRLNFLRQGILDDRVGFDGLTGLRNRQSFDDYLDKTWRLAKRQKRPVSLMMIDIDYFKKYNDLYGHQAGDRCLQRVADVFKPVPRRPMDFVGRYGGEEFVIVLYESLEQYARECAERIRAQVEGLQLPHGGSGTGKVVTVSIGLAHIKPHESKRSKEGFLQLADEALYQAKESGRNVVAKSSAGDKGIKTGIFRREVGKA